MQVILNRKYILLICFAGFLIALDQLTKIYVHTEFQLHESVAVVENFFHLTYVRNFGAAFGFLSQTPTVFREIFFLAMPPIACAIILYILQGTESSNTKQILSLSAIFGGAIGNYIDRIQYRYVIDFLDFHIYGKYSWPAFNIADMGIVLGVIALLYFMVTEKEKKTKEI